MGRALLWAAGLAASLALHAGGAMLWTLAWDPDSPEAQATPESQLEFETLDAPRQEAVAREPETEAAEEAAAEGAALAPGAVPQSRAAPLPPPGARLPELAPAADRLTESAAAPATVPALDAAAQTVADALPSATPIAAATPDAERLAPSAPATGATLAETRPPAATASPAPPQGSAVAALAPDAPSAPAVSPDAPKAAEPPLPAQSARAATAWQFSDRIVTDPQAIATIQAFMTPEALENSPTSAGELRDGLSGVLTGVDCARLSATYIPETGMLELRGHIPDPALQGPILAAMRAQVGDGIALSANLLHLPAPQCGALTGIAAAGLPQSTDQFTNERLVGETSHARAYSYTEGERLQFDLTAPDYDAFIYVDYFNADGDVIHLVPNDFIELEKSAAKSILGVGQDRPGQPGLRITIGPPFGQEIAVAFAASRPLYTGERPLVEPAGPYLDFLKERIAEARSADPDFKGEWVYFFMSTSPATQ